MASLLILQLNGNSGLCNRDKKHNELWIFKWLALTRVIMTHVMQRVTVVIKCPCSPVSELEAPPPLMQAERPCSLLRCHHSRKEVSPHFGSRSARDRRQLGMCAMS